MVSDSAPQDLRQKAHERVAEQSFRNLQKARDKAAQKSSYDWKLTHERLYIAGTGSGKTILFMMPLMIDATRKILIISPLY